MRETRDSFSSFGSFPRTSRRVILLSILLQSLNSVWHFARQQRRASVACSNKKKERKMIEERMGLLAIRINQTFWPGFIGNAASFFNMFGSLFVSLMKNV